MTIRNGRCSFAEWRPLGKEDEPLIKQKYLIYHTMGGNLAVVDRMFRVDGYYGTEAHFGVGGRWSSEDKDGELFQWQLTNHQADAQFAGNLAGVSIETADGGNPNNQWTSNMLGTLIKVTVDWCEDTGNPCQLLKKESDDGLGWHSMFHDWNEDNHGCPGQVRIGQIRTTVIPKARALLNGTKHHIGVHHEFVHLEIDGVFGHNTVSDLQLALGFKGKEVDGVFGPSTRRKLQHKVGAKVTGNIDGQTVRAWKHYLKKRHHWPWQAHTIDGKWGHGLTAQLQKALNAHEF